MPAAVVGVAEVADPTAAVAVVVVAVAAAEATNNPHRISLEGAANLNAAPFVSWGAFTMRSLRAYGW